MVLASELSEYLPVVILAVLALLFAVLSLGVSAMLRPNRPTPAKLAPYECGIEPERQRGALPCALVDRHQSKKPKGWLGPDPSR